MKEAALFPESSSQLVLWEVNFIGRIARVPLNLPLYTDHVLYVTSSEKQCFNQNDFRTNPHSGCRVVAERKPCGERAPRRTAIGHRCE